VRVPLSVLVREQGLAVELRLLVQHERRRTDLGLARARAVEDRPAPVVHHVQRDAYEAANHSERHEQQLHARDVAVAVVVDARDSERKERQTNVLRPIKRVEC